MGLRAVRRHLVWHCALHRPQRGITEVSASDETRVAVRSARRRSAVFWSTEMMPTIAQMSLARAIVIVTYSDEMLGCRGRGLSVAMVGCHMGRSANAARRAVFPRGPTVVCQSPTSRPSRSAPTRRDCRAVTSCTTRGVMSAVRVTPVGAVVPVYQRCTRSGKWFGPVLLESGRLINPCARSHILHMRCETLPK